MKQDEACVILCRKVYNKNDMSKFKSMIDQEYRVHWLLDNLPVAVRNDELGYVSRGYPVGFVANGAKRPSTLFTITRALLCATLKNPRSSLEPGL